MNTARPLKALGVLLPGGTLLLPGAAAPLPRWPGAYVLLLGFATGFVARHRTAQRDFAAGWYAYCGSARGRGGVGARIGRHFRKGKAPRWHIDPLSIRAGPMAALAFSGGDECSLVATLAGSGRFAFPVSGFGSSDCRICPAHLLRWTGG